MMFADLHLHSRYSDGTYTPGQVAQAAVAHALSAVALTDHDTVEGCAATQGACAQAGVEFVSGLELTTEFEGRELHLLGYGIDLHHARLLERLAVFQQARQKRIRDMVARLHELGVPLDLEAVLRVADCRAPGRPHIARVLVEAGHCATHDEAFERFLKRNRPAWMPKYKASAPEAIELIHEAGGVAVLAHPGINNVDDLIGLLAARGLDGLECYHTKHSPASSERYVQVAKQHRLLVTGGSDCHGLSKGRPAIGGVRLPWAYYETLRGRLTGREALPASGLPNPCTARTND
jgi:predicted metal-dependent phosphoesterase TrpH